MNSNKKEQAKEINIKKDRKQIEKIIRLNLPLMNKNKIMIQEVADAILCYIMGVIK